MKFSPCEPNRAVWCTAGLGSENIERPLPPRSLASFGTKFCTWLASSNRSTDPSSFLSPFRSASSKAHVKVRDACQISITPSQASWPSEAAVNTGRPVASWRRPTTPTKGTTGELTARVARASSPNLDPSPRTARINQTLRDYTEHLIDGGIFPEDSSATRRCGRGPWGLLAHSIA